MSSCDHLWECGYDENKVLEYSKLAEQCSGTIDEYDISIHICSTCGGILIRCNGIWYTRTTLATPRGIVAK